MLHMLRKRNDLCKYGSNSGKSSKYNVPMHRGARHAVRPGIHMQCGVRSADSPSITMPRGTRRLAVHGKIPV